MHTLALMQEQNAREFERIKDRAAPPWEPGLVPVRFAHQIDISRTDPRMYAALEKAASLSHTAKAKGHIDAILSDRAVAVVDAAAGGSNRAVMALSLPPLCPSFLLRFFSRISSPQKFRLVLTGLIERSPPPRGGFLVG